MSFNGSGTFLINSSGQPVVTNTVISSTAFNALTADLGTGLSTTITKDGQTTATAKIPFALGLSAAAASNLAAGTVAAPGLYLSTDTGTGLYRIGANNYGFAVSGAKVLDIASTGLGVTGTLSSSSTTTATAFIPSSSTVPTNGMYLSAANTLAWSVNSSKQMYLSGTAGLQIGTGTNQLLQIGDATGNNGVTQWFSGSNSARNWAINVHDFASGRFSIIQANSNGGVIGSAATEAVYIANGGTSWTSASDETLKDITDDITGALDQVTRARTVRGTYKRDPDTPHSFLIAQDWQDYLPEAISTGNDGKLGLSYTETIPVAFAAIKELIAKNETLEARLAAIEAK